MEDEFITEDNCKDSPIMKYGKKSKLKSKPHSFLTLLTTIIILSFSILFFYLLFSSKINNNFLIDKKPSGEEFDRNSSLYKFVHTPLKIKSLTLKNRIIMPPMVNNKSKEGFINDEMLEYYDQRAEKLGLVIVENGYVKKSEIPTKLPLISYAEDDKIPGLKKLVDTIHKHNIPVIAQIGHDGAAVGISSSDGEVNGVKYHSMSKEEILDIENCFVQAAIRAKKAGYDGVEIHSAHGYLLYQFYSPYYNKRTDEYGKNRIKIHLEIIKKIRKELGNDYPIFLRLGGSDYCEGGATIQDAVKASIEFEKAGIDCLDISGGRTDFLNPNDKSPGYFREATTEIKKNVKIPVILTGGVKTTEQAEELLKNGCADLIGVGREIFKNADWAKKNL